MTVGATSADRLTATPGDASTGPSALASVVPAPAYLTADDVGALLQLSPKSIYRLAKDDPTLPMLKIGGSVRFPRERLLTWLRAREQGPPRTRKQVLAVAKLATTIEAARG
jgi:excisionase family DNA binding protein